MRGLDGRPSELSCSANILRISVFCLLLRTRVQLRACKAFELLYLRHQLFQLPLASVLRFTQCTRIDQAGGQDSGGQRADRPNQQRFNSGIVPRNKASRNCDGLQPQLVRVDRYPALQHTQLAYPIDLLQCQSGLTPSTRYCISSRTVTHLYGSPIITMGRTSRKGRLVSCQRWQVDPAFC